MKTFLGITKGCWCGSSAVKQNINEVKQSKVQEAGVYPKFLVKNFAQVIKRSSNSVAYAFVWCYPLVGSMVLLGHARFR